MSEELKAQYERDIESGYPEPWKLWECNIDGDILWRGSFINPSFTLPELIRYRRRHDADQIILDWQREKYAEDCEWHPRPWELWESEDKYGGGWEPIQCNIKLDGSLYYRRRPDAPTREQWEAERKGEKMSIPIRSAASRCIEKADKCATCRHTYAPKPRIIHVRVQFPDGKFYEADLPEPMREAPDYGETFFIILIYSCTVREENWSAFAADKVHLAAGLCHRTDADAQVWLNFFKQLRNDK